MIKKHRKATPAEKKAVRAAYRKQKLKNYALNLLRPLPKHQVRLLIFGQGRSGSTLLESLLASTGNFRLSGERLSPFYLTRYHQGEARFPVSYIHGFVKQHPTKILFFTSNPAICWRNAKSPSSPGQVLREFQRYGWQVVFLWRRNRVKHALSNLVRKHRGHSHKLDDAPERYRLRIDCDDFVKRVMEKFEAERIEREALRGIDFQEVVYEDHLERAAQHQPTIDRLLQAISLDPKTVTTEYRKVNTQSMADLIENYDEFCQRVIDQGWGHFLD